MSLDSKVDLEVDAIQTKSDRQKGSLLCAVDHCTVGVISLNPVSPFHPG